MNIDFIEYKVQTMIGNGKIVLIDIDDFELIKPYLPIYINHYGYAWINIDKKPIRLHRFILGFPTDKIIDHISGNKLDNRKINLRLCNKTENGRNRNKTITNSCEFKGVYKTQNYERWEAKIDIGNDEKSKSFFSKEAAAYQYNLWSIKYHHEFSKLNIINLNEDEILNIEKTSRENYLLYKKQCKYEHVFRFQSRGEWKNKWRGRITINKIKYITTLCDSEDEAYNELLRLLKSNNIIYPKEVFEK